MEKFFVGLFDTEFTSRITVTAFLICVGVSLVLGIILAIAYMFKTRYTKSFVSTLALLPAVVCVVIMMVNGNIGTGVAVAGAFSLVRFRSVPGTAKEIGALFVAMGSGLIAGMGYLGFSVLFTIIMAIAFVIYNSLNLGEGKRVAAYKTLVITIPESLNYTDLFDDIFKEYAKSYDLVFVKSTNMGSMFKLTYNICLKKAINEKEMLDKIRTRNGNLEVAIYYQETLESVKL